jgi:hypothetical protein
MLTLRQQLLEQRVQRRQATDDIGRCSHEQRPGNDDESNPMAGFCCKLVLELIEAALLKCSHRPRPEDVRR